jgi:hypothetical protein
MRRKVFVCLCALACASTIAAESATVRVQSAPPSAPATSATGRAPATLQRDELVYVVAHTAVDCPICKVWRVSDSGLPAAEHLPTTWPHVRFVLIERHSLYGSEDEALYPRELHFLYQERRDRYMLSPPTPLFEIVVRNRVVLRMAGLQDWTDHVIPAVQQLERSRE